MPKRFTRRQILGAASTGLLATKGARPAASSDKPAILGGRPVRTAPFPSWPVIAENDERAWTEVLHKGKWNRLDGDYARQFEETWAATLGAKHCLATANGTSALFISLNALGIGPGDEVIVPPYTFVATVNAVLLQHALPVFVDTEIETSQINGVTKKDFYMVTGRYDMVIISEAPDDAALAKGMLAVASKGAIQTETLRVFTEKEYRGIIGSL